MAILDHNGLPIVREMQTTLDDNLSRIAQMPPSSVTRGLTPARLGALLEGAHGGDLSAIADLGHEMQIKNGHIYAEMARRKRSVTLLDWNLTPPNNASAEEERDTEMLEEALKSAHWLNKTLFNALDAVLTGYSCQEIEWGNEGSLQFPTNIHFRPPRMFKTHDKNRGRLVINDGTMQGQGFRQYGWINHFSPSLSGYISEVSLTQVLAWPFVFHSYPTRDLMEFLEIYGIPLRLGKYPSGASDEEKNTLLRAVMAIGHHAGGIIPHNMAIEFAAAAMGGSAEFLSVIDWAEKTISKIILGGTLTSQADGLTSTNALGNVHENGRLEIRDSDIAMIEPTLSRQLILPIWALNAKSYDNPRRYPTFSFDTSIPEDLTMYATALPPLVDMGMRISIKDIHEKLQFPMADEGEEILKRIETPNPYQFGALKNNLVALKSNDKPPIAGEAREVKGGEGNKPLEEGRFDPAQNALEDAINGLTAAELASAADPLLEPILAALKAQGLDSAKKLIGELYTEMDTSEMTELLTRAIFVADLWGQINAEREE